MRLGHLAIAAALIGAVAPACAGVLELTGPLVQGGLVEGHVEPGSSVAVDGRAVRVSPEGIFLMGFGRDATEATVEVTHKDGTREQRRLEVGKRAFDIQRIEGLPEKMVTPPPELMERIRLEGEKVDQVRRRDDARTDFLAGFAWPAIGPISGVYGSQRILNGEPRAPHYGVDIAAPRGTPVLAPADGIVTMVADLYFTGWTVILDHGFGLSSVLMHMDAALVHEGQRVKRGDPLGKLGATGRVTGPHVHWGMNLFRTRLDPALLVPPMPKPE